MRFLKTNTAVIVAVGPFIGQDGFTRKTSLTITNERITLTADTDAGSAPTIILDNVTGATSGTSNDLNYITGQDNGMMQLELAAADVNRLGRMTLTINDATDANHLPVVHDFCVLPELIYESFITGGPTFPLFGIIDSGTAQAATGTTLQHRSAAAFADSEVNGATDYVYSASAGAGQGRIVDSYVGSTDTATVGTWTTTPTGTIKYITFRTVPASAALLPAVNATQILGTAISTPATAGILDVNVKNIDNDAASASGTVTFPNATLASTTNITAGTITTVTNLTNAPTAGDLTATMKTSVTTAATAATPTISTLGANTITATSIAANAITAAKVATDAVGAAQLAADAVTEIAAGVLTSAMTEAYSTDGSTFTVAQALYLIAQRLGEFSISGTTLTVKKVDGSTTAATYTLNDGTSPTSITRAS